MSALFIFILGWFALGLVGVKMGRDALRQILPTHEPDPATYVTVVAGPFNILLVWMIFREEQGSDDFLIWTPLRWLWRGVLSLAMAWDLVTAERLLRQGDYLWAAVCAALTLLLLYILAKDLKS